MKKYIHFGRDLATWYASIKFLEKKKDVPSINCCQKVIKDVTYYESILEHFKNDE